MVRTRFPKREKLLRTKIPKNKSGIYQIRSKQNNKVYIGSASNLKNRKRVHFKDLENNKHHNPHLQRHYDKYGKEDLVFEILEFCPKEELMDLEDSYFILYKWKFNICPKAGIYLGWHHTNSTKEQMSNSRKGCSIPKEVKERISKTLQGHPVSKEVREILSQKVKEYYKTHNAAFKGKKHTPEAKQKIGKASKGNKNCVGHIPTAKTKQKIKEGNIKYWNSKEGKQKAIERQRKFQTSEAGEKDREKRRNQVISKKTRLKISNTLKAKGRKPTEK
jgi:group I intron endonuclease